MQFLILKNHLEEIREGIIKKKLTKFFFARHLWQEMISTISIKISFYLLFLPAEKGIHKKYIYII